MARKSYRIWKMVYKLADDVGSINIIVFVHALQNLPLNSLFSISIFQLVIPNITFLKYSHSLK